MQVLLQLLILGRRKSAVNRPDSRFASAQRDAASGDAAAARGFRVAPASQLVS